MAPTGTIIPVFLACLDIGAFASTLKLRHLHHKRSGYPFNELVAFGDELSDNGNGSYAHNITGGGTNNYGFGTWTDGPVAISYLTDLLDVPLNDYAFGSSNGGSTIGVTIDNVYTVSGSKLLSGQAIPSVHDQIHNNYTLNGAPENIENALQFIWVGQADLLEQVDWFFNWDPKNTWFADNISERITSDAEYLIESGAPYVFVANIYPKHRAPVSWTYLCGDSDCTTVLDTLGEIISQANTAIESALKSSKHAEKFIYYDVFSFMNNLMDNKNDWGLTAPVTGYCDGDAKASWDTCAAGSYVWEGATKFVDTPSLIVATRSLPYRLFGWLHLAAANHLSHPELLTSPLTHC